MQPLAHLPAMPPLPAGPRPSTPKAPPASHNYSKPSGPQPPPFKAPPPDYDDRDQVPRRGEAPLHDIYERLPFHFSLYQGLPRQLPEAHVYDIVFAAMPSLGGMLLYQARIEEISPDLST